MTQSDASAGRTVLIADDDPRLRNLLTWTLEQGQYNVVAAAPLAERDWPASAACLSPGAM